MSSMKKQWEMMVLDGTPPLKSTCSHAVGDIDCDGNPEMIVGGDGALLWYRPKTFEKGIVAKGHFPVGLTLADLDGDGRMEVVTGDQDETGWHICWFKPGKTLFEPWQRFVVDALPTGAPHDVLFCDIDGDGKSELLVNAMGRGGRGAGLFAYKRQADVQEPWKKFIIEDEIFTEGLAVGDLNGDGKMEIVHGPYYYLPPKGKILGSKWKRSVYAPGFREMLRVTLVPIAGTKTLDIVAVESEWLCGRMSWFENRMRKSPTTPWIEHEMDRPMYYAHSLHARYDRKRKKTTVFVGEMAKGGYGAPINRGARLMEYATSTHGRTWKTEIISRGVGSHEAIPFDLDGDGELEVAGKTCAQKEIRPIVQVWKKKRPSALSQFRHRFLDRDKPELSTDIVAMDVDADGQNDVVCGRFWYKNGTWERRTIPGICQGLYAADLDGDGRDELIAIKRKTEELTDYKALSSKLCWLKAVDPLRGKWEEYPIGEGHGDWPHGICVAPVLPGGKLALLVGYHDAKKNSTKPELFEVADDPCQGPWNKRVLADIEYGEEIEAFDIDGDGNLDIVAGPYWLENKGDGTFESHLYAGDFEIARVGVADINGDGRPDIVAGGEGLDFPNRTALHSPVVWFQQPADPRQVPWEKHIIDHIRCPHSLDVADFDHDGVTEVVCGEHDPFFQYRARCRTFVYKRAEPCGDSWWRYEVDNRFEHHDGTKVIDLGNGQLGIMSHGWKESKYVHLWTMEK